MCKGLPASGKSTWAKQQNAKRVNRDDLRSMIDDGKWSKENEKYIVKIEQDIVMTYLGGQNDVIVDDTNLHPKNEAMWKVFAEQFKADFEVKDFTDVSLSECIKRDKNRTNSVGEKVIRRMHDQFLREKEKPLNPMVFDTSLPYCVIFDLDGTLATIGDRSPYDGKSCAVDLVNESIRELYWKMTIEDTKAIIFSGRNGDSEPETREWLENNDIRFDELHMREPGDIRKDSIIKEEMFDKFIRGKYNVIMIVDDRKQVVEMWRKLGLTCVQVNEGDF